MSEAQTTIFQVPAEISKIVSMANRSVRLVCDTQENLTDEQMAKAMGMLQKTGWLTISVEPVKAEDLLNLPELTYDKDEKTSSQRLRACLFILWEQKGKPTETFQSFYEQNLERFINAVKEKLT